MTESMCDLVGHQPGTIDVDTNYVTCSRCDAQFMFDPSDPWPDGWDEKWETRIRAALLITSRTGYFHPDVSMVFNPSLSENEIVVRYGSM